MGVSLTACAGGSLICCGFSGTGGLAFPVDLLEWWNVARRAFVKHLLQLQGSSLAISSLRAVNPGPCDDNFSRLRDLLRGFSSILVGLAVSAPVNDPALIVTEPDLDSSDVFVLPKVARV